MSAVNQPTYFVERKGWFSSTLEPVTKEAFKAHQSEKYTTFSFLNKAAQTVALGILALSQSARFAMRSSFSGTQAALSLLGLHFWSQIPTACAQNAPGPQFQINTDNTGIHQNPSVVPLGAGFIATWASHPIDGSYTYAKDWGIYAQEFDGSGAKVGSQFEVPNNRNGSQNSPQLFSLGGGGFCILWDIISYDPFIDGTFAQRFDGSGAKVGSEFELPFGVIAAIAPLGEGFVILTQPTNFYNITNDPLFAQLLNATGSPLGNGTFITTLSANPSLTSLSAGGFVVAWETQQLNQIQTDGVHAQLFNAAGKKVGAELVIDSTTDQPRYPKVVSLQGGGFVIMWPGFQPSTHINGQVFDGVGAKVGRGFQIPNTYDIGRIAPMEGGGFLVSWVELQYNSNIDQSLNGQLFDAMGAEVGSVFMIGTNAIGNSTIKALVPGQATSLKGGGFVVTWYGDDPVVSEIYGRIYPANYTYTTQQMPESTLVSTPTANNSRLVSGSSMLPSSSLNFTNSQSSMRGGSGFTLPAGINIPIAAGIGGGVIAFLISSVVGVCVCLRGRSRSRMGHHEQGSFRPQFTASLRGSDRIGPVDRASFKSARYSERIDGDEDADIEEALRVIMNRKA